MPDELSKLKLVFLLGQVLSALLASFLLQHFPYSPKRKTVVAQDFYNLLHTSQFLLN